MAGRIKIQSLLPFMLAEDDLGKDLTDDFLNRALEQLIDQEEALEAESVGQSSMERAALKHFVVASHVRLNVRPPICCVCASYVCSFQACDASSSPTERAAKAPTVKYFAPPPPPKHAQPAPAADTVQAKPAATAPPPPAPASKPDEEATLLELKEQELEERIRFNEEQVRQTEELKKYVAQKKAQHQEAAARNTRQKPVETAEAWAERVAHECAEEEAKAYAQEHGRLSAECAPKSPAREPSKASKMDLSPMTAIQEAEQEEARLMKEMAGPSRKTSESWKRSSKGLPSCERSLQARFRPQTRLLAPRLSLRQLPNPPHPRQPKPRLLCL